MKLINREIAVSDVLPKTLMILKLIVRAIILFRRPLRLIGFYILSKPLPERIIHLRNGKKIILSSCPHDLITVIVLFCKREYGDTPKGGNIVDIGANIGVYSLYAIFNGAAKVYAFEPNREAYEVLLRNIEENELSGRIVASNLAVTGNDEDRVWIPVNSDPNNQIVKGNAMREDDSIEVETISLKSIIRKYELDTVDLVKMDCEGAEYDIVEATSGESCDLIKQLRFEYHQGTDRLTYHLQKFGFNVSGYYPDSLKVGRIFYSKG